MSVTQLVPPEVLSAFATHAERTFESIFAAMPPDFAGAFIDQAVEELGETLHASAAAVKARHGIATSPHTRSVPPVTG